MMPAIVTVSLSAGSKALAQKKVLVKRLVAIEDLGNIDILFTDKTGTAPTRSWACCRSTMTGSWPLCWCEILTAGCS
jgi:P-type Mg2+ transporter